MVVFACNHCGESVKKNQVDRHYQFKCRNAPVFVSCMDCQKDFRDKEYDAHTSCITEAEKYSGKDYVPKASHNAGLRKQEDWIDIVRSVLSSNEQKVSPIARRHLQRLLDYSNVPRKKSKFINFVGNSLRIKPKEAQELWNIMEVAIEKFKSRSQKVKAESDSAVNGEEDAKPKTEQNGEQEQNGNEDDGDKTEKKKKKKRKTEEALEETADATECSEEQSAKKKKKKSKNTEQPNENGQENEPGMANGTTEPNEAESNKKKKKKSKQTDENTNAEIEIDEDQSSTKKKKQSEDTVPPTANKKDKTLPNANKVLPFDWNNAIYDIIEKNGNELAMEKLKKKVLKKYQKQHEIETVPWKVEKTFEKKLKKSGLQIDGNLVKARIK